jgi:hypothetical protein
LFKLKADAIRRYFIFSSTALATLLNALLTFDASGRLPCAMLGRPPPRPQLAGSSQITRRRNHRRDDSTEGSQRCDFAGAKKWMQFQLLQAAAVK